MAKGRFVQVEKLRAVADRIKECEEMENFLRERNDILEADRYLSRWCEIEKTLETLGLKEVNGVMADTRLVVKLTKRQARITLEALQNAQRAAEPDEDRGLWRDIQRIAQPLAEYVNRLDGDKDRERVEE